MAWLRHKRCMVVIERIDDRSSILNCIPKRHRRSHSESRFRRVDIVIGTIVQFDSNIFHRTAWWNPSRRSLSESLLDGWNELLRNRACKKPVFEHESRRRLTWMDADFHVAVFSAKDAQPGITAFAARRPRQPCLWRASPSHRSQF